MEFISMQDARRISALSPEIRESDHAQFGKLNVVRVYFQEMDGDSGCYYTWKEYYLLK